MAALPPYDPVAFQKMYIELRGYYDAEYEKFFNLPDKDMQEYIFSEANKRKLHREFFSLNRMIYNFQQLRRTWIEDRANTITTLYKITRYGMTCIYGYSYSSVVETDGVVTADLKYCQSGPTYISMDGEYRRNIVLVRNVNGVMAKFPDVFTAAEEYILEMLDRGEIRLQRKHYYPPGFKSKDAYENMLSDRRFDLQLLKYGWAMHSVIVRHMILANHINPAFAAIFADEKLLGIYAGVKIYDGKDFGYINHTALEQGDYTCRTLEVGQKTFPMTVYEAMRIGDINFPVWREIYLTTLCSNLVVNYISPGFPLIGNWFLIHGTNSDYYDNVSMHDKHTHSQIASSISAQLKLIDRETFFNQTRQHINNKFMRLSRKIQQSFVYADREIRLTGLSLVLQSEFVGWTMRDIPPLLKKTHSKYAIFRDPDIFSKHMFEYIYSFYCMNYHLSILHGDLHLNNLTMNQWVSRTSFQDLETYIIYHIGGKYYAFQHAETFSTIIDFSRAIIADRAKIENEFGERFAAIFFSEQEIRLIQIVYKYFPRLIEKYPILRNYVKTHFDVMFKILTAIDTYVTMTNILVLFDIEDFGYPIPRECKDLCTRISKLAFAIINKYLIMIATGSLSTLDFEFPNLQIIQQIFAPYVVSAKEVTEARPIITDLFDADNPMKYDCEDYDRWSPIMRYDKLIELCQTYNIPVPAAVPASIDHETNDQLDDINKILPMYDLRTEENVSFESWSMV